MVFGTDHCHGQHAERGGGTNLREADGVLQSLYPDALCMAPRRDRGDVVADGSRLQDYVRSGLEIFPGASCRHTLPGERIESFAVDTAHDPLLICTAQHPSAPVQTQVTVWAAIHKYSERAFVVY